MEASPCFRASDGRMLYKAETNLHHLMWRSDWYKTTPERKFRNATGMVIRLAIRSHNELHREVEPPHKPNGNLMRNMHVATRDMEFTNQYDHFVQIAHYLGEVVGSEQCAQNVEDAALLLESFRQQAPYIEQGRIEHVRA